MLTFNFSIDDISKRTAERAFCGTSFSPEKRGEQRRQAYFDHMQAVKADFEQWVTEGNAEGMSVDLENYRLKYKIMLENYLGAHSRVMSTMITGPAKFPTRSNRKKSDTADRRLNELIEWSKKRLKKLEAKYNPQMIANAPIMAGSDDALARLRKKLAKLEARQEAMKLCNKIIRSKAFKAADYSGQVQQLKGATGWKDETIHNILKPDYLGKVGFAGFYLSNNNAEMRRIKGRIAELERLAQQETSSDERPDGITVERDPDAARIRLYFPDKPDKAARTLLKQNGFRWAPSIGAWQRQLNSNGEYAVERVLARIDEWQGM